MVLRRNEKVEIDQELAEASITFQCEGCSREFRVDASKAGQRGKCPKCGSIFSVPTRTEEVPIFEESMLSVEDPLLAEIHDQLRRKVELSLLSEQVVSDAMVRFDLLIDEHGRHQNIFLSLKKSDFDNHPCLVCHTIIGVIEEVDALVMMLQHMCNRPQFSLNFFNDNTAVLLCVYPMIEGVDLEALACMITGVASLGDAFEQKIFNYDHA